MFRETINYIVKLKREGENWIKTFAKLIRKQVTLNIKVRELRKKS